MEVIEVEYRRFKGEIFEFKKQWVGLASADYTFTSYAKRNGRSNRENAVQWDFRFASIEYNYLI